MLVDGLSLQRQEPYLRRLHAGLRGDGEIGHAPSSNHGAARLHPPPPEIVVDVIQEPQPLLEV